MIQCYKSQIEREKELEEDVYTFDDNDYLVKKNKDEIQNKKRD